MAQIILGIIVFLVECFVRGYKIQKAKNQKQLPKTEIKRRKDAKKRKAIANLRY